MGGATPRSIRPARLRKVGAGLIALLAGCGGGSTTAQRKGQLYGTVTRGPTSPVCRKGTPCTEPAEGVRLFFSQGDTVNARVVVAKDGHYSVSLTPGTYLV